MKPPWTAGHPAMFAAGYVLLSFTNLPTPASGLWRPLAAAFFGALVLSLLLGAITRSRALGALLATAIVLLLSASWLLAAVAGVAILWIGLVTVLRRARSLCWDNRTLRVSGASVRASSKLPTSISLKKW